MSLRKTSALTLRVLKATVLLGSAQMVNILAAILRTKFVAVWLGPSGVGLNSLLNTNISLISTATQLNIRDSSVREIAATRDADSDMAVAVIRRTCLLLGLFGTLLTAVFSPLLSYISFKNFDYTLSFVFLSPVMSFTAYTAGEFAVMQGFGRLKLMARTTAVSAATATAIAIPLFYFYRIDAIVPVIVLYSFVAALFCHLWRVKTVTQPPVTMRDIVCHGRRAIILGLYMTVSMLLTNVGQFVLAVYINRTGSIDAYGVYQAGFTLVNSYVGILFNALSLEYYPRLAEYAGRPFICRGLMLHELRLIVRMVGPLIVVFIFCSDWIVRLLYSSQFAGVLPYVDYAIIGALFRGVSLCFALRILAEGDGRAYIFTETSSVIVGLVLNILGLHFYSYGGLGFSYVLWYGFYALLTWAVCRRRYGLRLNASFLALLLGAVALGFAALAIKKLIFWIAL
mgnify:CR=1 FL=1